MNIIEFKTGLENIDNIILQTGHLSKIIEGPTDRICKALSELFYAKHAYINAFVNDRCPAYMRRIESHAVIDLTEVGATYLTFTAARRNTNGTISVSISDFDEPVMKVDE